MYELLIDEDCCKVYTIMELVDGGEMFETLKNSYYSEEDARMLFK